MVKKKRGKKRSYSKKKEPESPLYQIKNKPFWASLVIVLLISVIFIMSAIESDVITGHATTQTIGFVKESTDLFFEVKVGGIQTITANFMEDVKSAKLFFDEDPTISFDGIVFSKVKATSEDEDKIGDIMITLKIKDLDLREKGIDPKQLVLLQNGEKLDLEITAEDGIYDYFYAEGYGLGDFALGRPVAKVLEKPVIEAAEVVPEVKESVMEEKEAVVGKAIGEPVVVKDGFFSKVKDFFGNLFS